MLFYPQFTVILASVMFFTGLVSFIYSWGHILSTLISLEFMALALFFTISISSSSSWTEFFLALIYLAVAVCEGALGLSILVVSVQKYGNDMLSNLNFTSW